MDQITQLGEQVQKATTPEQIKTLFTQLKKSLLKEGLLAITAAQLDPECPNYASTIDKMSKLVDAYQSFAVMATKVQAFDLFSSIFAQLTPFYIDFLPILTHSDAEAFNSTRLAIISVRLLVLLTDVSDTARSSLQQFHCQLEYLTPTERQNDTIKAVLDLEQGFMQGAYSHLIKSPATTTLTQQIPGVNGLTQNLKNIVLSKVAHVVANSSKRYPIQQLKNTYHLDDADIDVMVKDNNWKVIDGVIVFNGEGAASNNADAMADGPVVGGAALTKQEIQLEENKAAANQFVINAIKMAKQMEEIV